MLGASRPSTMFQAANREALCHYLLHPLHQAKSNIGICVAHHCQFDCISCCGHVTDTDPQYAINKSKILLGFVGPQWEEKIVVELESALNKWADSVPDHRKLFLAVLIHSKHPLVRWDPNREDDTFFNQSASLYCFYYHIQILVHRPFIPSPRRPVPLPFPSLAICTNAARSCSHVASIQGRRFSIAPPPIQVLFLLKDPRINHT